MSEKRPTNGQKWPKCPFFVSNTAKTENGAYLGLCGSKPSSEGTYSTRNAPLFCGFEASESPGQHSPRTVGANGGSTGVPGAKKMIFLEVVPRPLGMLKQVFLGRFEPVVAR